MDKIDILEKFPGLMCELRLKEAKGVLTTAVNDYCAAFKQLKDNPADFLIKGKDDLLQPNEIEEIRQLSF
ncbi:MAG: hypothetical protein M1514_00920, partial [Patescibacteria group bacterium]|nr:hypothetical protein [Patescibacteria group bacterium]